MLKLLIPLMLVSSIAMASPNARLERAIQGAAGTAVSFEFVKEMAPQRADLAKHAIAGGAIATVVGSLTTPGEGWKAGVIVGAGKEIVNDAIMKRGHPQVDDFIVTAGASILSSSLSSDFTALVFFNKDGGDLYFSYRF